MLGRCRDMLHSLLSGLEEVCEVCCTQSIEIGILGGDGALPTGVGRAVSSQAVLCLEAVDAAIAPPGAVHGEAGGRVQWRGWTSLAVVGRISRRWWCSARSRAAAAQWDVLAGSCLLLWSLLARGDSVIHPRASFARFTEGCYDRR